MSTPTRELENLFIGGNMQTGNVRSQGQVRRRQRERAEREEQQRRERAESEERRRQESATRAGPSGTQTGTTYDQMVAAQQVFPIAGSSETQPGQLPAAPVLGHTGLLYDIQQLSPSSRPRAAEGLNSEEFTVDHVMRKDSDGIFYYGFQLKKPESVRISDRASGRPSVTCTCEEFRTRPFPCVHIFWLFDGLNSVLSDPSRSSVQVVTNTNVLERIAGLYDDIGDHLDPSNNRLDSLTKALNRTRGEDAIIESDDIDSETSSQAGDQDRMDWVVQDMLSVFDDRRLPEEYGRQDFVHNIAVGAVFLQDLIDPQSLEATIYGLARHDRKFRRRLRKTLTKDFCAEQFLNKINSRIRRLLARLDRHVAQGTQSEPNIINECAGILRGCVQQVQQYREDRAPLSQKIRSEAAQVMVDLLQTVCERNFDIYTQITWPRTAQDPRDKDDRNLFTNLIGDADEETEDEYFVLAFLGSLAPHDWMHLLERLDSILDQLRGNGAPRAYVEKLERIIQTYDTHHSDPTRTIGERPPVTGEREPRRRRLG